VSPGGHGAGECCSRHRTGRTATHMEALDELLLADARRKKVGFAQPVRYALALHGARPATPGKGASAQTSNSGLPMLTPRALLLGIPAAAWLACVTAERRACYELVF
jgi:hypothetical protein